MPDIFRTHRRGGFSSLPRRWITTPADPLRRSHRSGTMTLEERIDPFPTKMSDDRRTQSSPFEKGELSAEQAD